MNKYGKEGVPFFFMIDFEMQKPVVIPLADIEDDILYDINGNRNYDGFTDISLSLDYKWTAYPREKYSVQFDKVLNEINYGNSYLLNLTARHEFISKASIKQMFYLAEAKYKLLFRDEFVVFSPESFVKIKDGMISSFPMKGTIDESIPYAERIILDDIKEKAEHNTIVDLIRNDLSMVSKKVEVQRFRYIDVIESDKVNLLQVSSEITGHLPHNYTSNLGDIIFTLLPAGSICGAPKKKTVEIIKSVEECTRSYYTGVAGIYDGQSLDSFVMIRYIENEGGQLYYRSGGGITSMSNVDSEYQEMIKKIYVPTA